MKFLLSLLGIILFAQIGAATTVVDILELPIGTPQSRISTMTNGWGGAFIEGKLYLKESRSTKYYLVIAFKQSHIDSITLEVVDKVDESDVLSIINNFEWVVKCSGGEYKESSIYRNDIKIVFVANKDQFIIDAKKDSYGDKKWYMSIVKTISPSK